MEKYMAGDQGVGEYCIPEKKEAFIF